MRETAADILTQLKPLCLPQCEKVRKAYDGIRAPFIYERNGGRYAGATDGHIAVFVASDAEAPSCPVNFDVIFARCAFSSGLQTDTTTLAAFAGQPEYDSQCGQCKGEGCDDCEGEGDIIADRRPGVINGVWCDLNLLARGLAVVPAGQCELFLATSQAGIYTEIPPIFLHGKEWWIVLMPMAKGINIDVPRIEIC
jgi:hypothetical protein